MDVAGLFPGFHTDTTSLFASSRDEKRRTKTSHWFGTTSGSLSLGAKNCGRCGFSWGHSTSPSRRRLFIHTKGTVPSCAFMRPCFVRKNTTGPVRTVMSSESRREGQPESRSIASNSACELGRNHGSLPLGNESRVENVSTKPRGSSTRRSNFIDSLCGTRSQDATTVSCRTASRENSSSRRANIVTFLRVPLERSDSRILPK